MLKKILGPRHCTRYKRYLQFWTWYCGHRFSVVGIGSWRLSAAPSWTEQQRILTFSPNAKEPPMNWCWRAFLLFSADARTENILLITGSILFLYKAHCELEGTKYSQGLVTNPASQRVVKHINTFWNLIKYMNILFLCYYLGILKGKLN